MMLRFGKTIMFLLFASLLVALSACGDSNNNEDNENANDNNTNEEANVDPEDMPEPDLEDVPDVIAEVNGEEIPKKEFKSAYQGQFQSALMQAQMSGEEIDQGQLKSQLADAMIGQELLIQEADSNEPDVSEEDIDETLQGVIKENGFESEDELFDTLEEQDTDKDSFMEEVKTQTKIDQLVSKEAGDVDPSEEELEETYEGLKKQQENLDGDKDDENADEAEQPEIPDYEEAKPQLKEKLIAQKEQEAYQKLVDKLRDDADITNHLS